MHLTSFFLVEKIGLTNKKGAPFLLSPIKTGGAAKAAPFYLGVANWWGVVRLVVTYKQWSGWLNAPSATYDCFSNIEYSNV